MSYDARMLSFHSVVEQERPRAEALPRSQRERLAHIDFVLYFLGELRRADVVDTFETGPAGATRDIGLYRELAGENLEFDNTAKVYRPTPRFKPLFKHSPFKALSTLSQGLGAALDADSEPMIRCEVAPALARPNVEVIATLSRAIHGGMAVSITYTSKSSGRTSKNIVPTAFVDSGERWHVRAFDREVKEFRDYVLTRIENPSLLENSPVSKEETAEADTQWARVIDLHLVAHPAHKRPEVVERDFDMRDGHIAVRVRAANVGYMLRRWAVDCSIDHRLSPDEYPLWLPDPFALYGASNARLAPGYEDPKKYSDKLRAEQV